MNLAVHVLSFTLSFWALSCVRFETFTNVRKPGQVRLLLLLLWRIAHSKTPLLLESSARCLRLLFQKGGDDGGD